MAIVGTWWDPRILVGSCNISGDSKKAELTYSADMLDGGVFGMHYKNNTSGLTSIGLSVGGLLPTSSPADVKEKQFFDSIAAPCTIPVTVMPENTPVEGGRAYLFQGGEFAYQTFGPHGQLMPFNLQINNGASGHNLIRGYVLEPGTAAKTVSGNGTGFVAGAITASQYLYATLHVFGMSVPMTLDVTIESDNAADFVGCTTRATFTQVTDTFASQYLTRVAGPITDTYWRAKWVIAGTSYTFACAMGIAA